MLLGEDNQNIFKKDTSKTEEDFLLNVEDIFPNADQPRNNFKAESIQQLAASIKEQGLLMPILVKISSKKDSEKGKYKIIAGERRWRACKILKMKKIKAIIVKNTSEKSDALAAIIENVQREDLSVLEEALAYDKLIKIYGMKHESIAKKTGKSRSYISNIIRILSLTSNVKKLLEEDQISFGHARALIGLENQEKLARMIIKDKMSVRELEIYLREERDKKEGKIFHKEISNTKDPNIIDYEKYLSVKLGYKVEINDKKGKGYLIVRYKNLEQLDAIVDLFNN